MIVNSLRGLNSPEARRKRLERQSHGIYVFLNTLYSNVSRFRKSADREGIPSIAVETGERWSNKSKRLRSSPYTLSGFWISSCNFFTEEGRVFRKLRISDSWHSHFRRKKEFSGHDERSINSMMLVAVGVNRKELWFQVGPSSESMPNSSSEGTVMLWNMEAVKEAKEEM